MPPDTPPAEPLTPAESALAERLYRYLRQFRRSGVRRLMLDLDGGTVYIRTIGPRLALSGLEIGANLEPT